MQDSGAGELLITSVSNEGTWTGPELEIAKSIASKVSVPCIINGGVGHEEHIYEALDSEVSAVELVLFPVSKKGLWSSRKHS